MYWLLGGAWGCCNIVLRSQPNTRQSAQKIVWTQNSKFISITMAPSGSESGSTTDSESDSGDDYDPLTPYVFDTSNVPPSPNPGYPVTATILFFHQHTTLSTTTKTKQSYYYNNYIDYYQALSLKHRSQPVISTTTSRHPTSHPTSLLPVHAHPCAVLTLRRIYTKRYNINLQTMAKVFIY